MKILFVTLLTLSCSLPADSFTDQTQFSLKLVYQAKDQPAVEIVTESKAKDYGTIVPIQRYAESVWQCALWLEDGPMPLAEVTISDPQLSRATDKDTSSPISLVKIKHPFKSGEAFEIIKTTQFSLTMTIMLLPEPAGAAKAEPAAPALEEKPLELTAEEIDLLQAKLEISMGTSPPALKVEGYNASKHHVTSLMVRVIIPKSKTSEEINRLYQVMIQSGGRPLEDFSVLKYITIAIPEGVKPVLSIEKAFWQK